MEIMQITAVGVAAAILSVILKRDSPAISLIVGLAAGLAIFFMTLPRLESLFSFFGDIASRAGGSLPYGGLLLKIIGVAYIAEFGAQICADAGESAIAGKIEFGGKIIILAISSPIIFSLLEQTLTMLG